MNAPNTAGFIKQHLIDPELCLACGSCAATCKENAIHEGDFGQAFAIDPNLCNNTHECLAVCGSEAISAWRMVPAGQTYSLEEQFSWETLPEELEVDGQTLVAELDEDEAPSGHPAPASANQPTTFMYTQSAPVIAQIKSNVRVTSPDSETAIHHIVLEFDDADFPWLEGQNVGVLPPGTDARGQAHHMRAYSIASDRDGETPGTREMALTIKRVIDEWEGKPYQGVASNFMCDLQPGDTVRCVGPIGAHFLMPQDSNSRIMMICTGTGIAPMRSFIQRQQRISETPAQPLQLFYGGRTPEEMAYYDELNTLPDTLLSKHLALSRSPTEPKRYVQDLLLEQADMVADFLKDKNSYLFVCGLISMEQGIMSALEKIAEQNGLDWASLHHDLQHEGRLQIETY
jgi:benzoyl-CoA 2,3-epoxidase subunit A